MWIIWSNMFHSGSRDGTGCHIPDRMRTQESRRSSSMCLCPSASPCSFYGHIKVGGAGGGGGGRSEDWLFFKTSPLIHGWKILNAQSKNHTRGFSPLPTFHCECTVTTFQTMSLVHMWMYFVQHAGIHLLPFISVWYETLVAVKSWMFAVVCYTGFEIGLTDF